MFSQFTKRLVASINFLKPSAINTAMRFYAGMNCKTPNQFPCTMEYPKKKCEEPECKPTEPCCPVPFSKCPAVKEDLCRERPDCCGSKRIARNPCNCRGARDFKQKKDLKLDRRILKKSVWEYPADCCGNPCPELLPRFDTLYYAPTDKAKRLYQQTWVECPPIRIRKRKVCCYDPTTLPPICRRKKSECPITACEFDSQKLKLLCKAGLNKKCPSIQSLCCIRGRFPPSCRYARPPADCKKKCCPYPAFSECCHPCPNPTKPRECECTRVLPNCIIYRALKRKLIYDLPPPLPAWPPKMLGPR